jgi:hypothetical protein
LAEYSPEGGDTMIKNMYMDGKFVPRDGDSKIEYLSRCGWFGGLAQLRQEFRDAEACGCSACQDKYGLPEKDSQAAPPKGALALAGAAIAIGMYFINKK